MLSLNNSSIINEHFEEILIKKEDVPAAYEVSIKRELVLLDESESVQDVKVS